MLLNRYLQEFSVHLQCVWKVLKYWIQYHYKLTATKLENL